MLAVCCGLGRRRLGGLPSILQTATTRGEDLLYALLAIVGPSPLRATNAPTWVSAQDLHPT